MFAVIMLYIYNISKARGVYLGYTRGRATPTVFPALYNLSETLPVVWNIKFDKLFVCIQRHFNRPLISGNKSDRRE